MCSAQTKYKNLSTVETFYPMNVLIIKVFKQKKLQHIQSKKITTRIGSQTIKMLNRLLSTCIDISKIKKSSYKLNLEYLKAQSNAFKRYFRWF